MIYAFYIYTAECLPGCHNGGTCLIPGVCLCPPGWCGERCEIGMKSLYHYNPLQKNCVQYIYLKKYIIFCFQKLSAIQLVIIEETAQHLVYVSAHKVSLESGVVKVIIKFYFR